MVIDCKNPFYAYRYSSLALADNFRHIATRPQHHGCCGRVAGRPLQTRCPTNSDDYQWALGCRDFSHIMLRYTDAFDLILTTASPSIITIRRQTHRSHPPTDRLTGLAGGTFIVTDLFRQIPCDGRRDHSLLSPIEIFAF